LVRPKVSVPVSGTTVLDFWVSRLYDAGFEAVVVNAYHLHEELVAAVRSRRWPIPVHVQVEPELLGTGGGIGNVLSFFQRQPFLVINGDIFCDVPLQDLLKQYLESGTTVGLLMHDCPEFNNVAVDQDGSIVAFGRKASKGAGESPEIRSLAFTGIQVIHPGVLDGVAPGHPGDILTIYRKMIADGDPPLALRMPEFFWREMGTVDSYRKLHEELGRMRENAMLPLQTGKAIVIDPAAEVSPPARLKGYVAVGRGSWVMEDAELENTVLWDNVRVGSGSRLHNCVVTDGVVIEGEHENEILTGLIS
jgi:NDP-sugar pyrophosphorylase family protein